VLGYVVMPEHFHLLISEPQETTPSVVMQVLRQRFARQTLRRSGLAPAEVGGDRLPAASEKDVNTHPFAPNAKG
jgi:REP element-mobilizing transposase RayT